MQKPAFHHKMRALRKDKGLTLDAMAKKLDVAPSYISRVERGELHLPPAKLKLFIDFFGVTVEELANYHGIDERARVADPTLVLRQELEEERNKVARIQENVQTFLKKNLQEFDLEEVHERGEEGAPERALKRLFDWKAITVLFNGECTSPGFFLSELYDEYSREQQHANFPEERYLKKTNADGSSSNEVNN